MFIEIGHFYTNERFTVESLKYLHEQKFAEDDILALFIDDYTFPHARELDVIRLKLACEEIVGRFVDVHYESSMASPKRILSAMLFLDYEKIDIVHINGVLSEKRFDGKKIFDYVTNRPSCQMLSFVWTMYRLGKISVCQRDENQVLTVIDKRYMKLENRVFGMVPKHLRDKLFYRFF